MAGRKVSLEEKIKKQEEVVFKAKDKYDAEVEKLDKLVMKLKEIESKELIRAFEKTNRSLEEILEFMGEKREDQD